MKKTTTTNYREDLTAADVLTLTAADVLTLTAADVLTLTAAAVENAMKRREADSGRDLQQMRIKYQEDARQETICEMYARAAGEWIEGETADGTPRAALPLAYFAAICAGTALDRIMYQDGGHAVKLTSKEARESYDGDARRAVIETRRTSSPVSKSPEGALIEAERLERIFAKLPPEIVERAADLARITYEGAESVREAARLAEMTEATARRTWQAVRDAARAVLIEDGDRAALERMNDEEHRRRAAKNRAKKDAAEAHRAAELKKSKPAPAGAVRFTVGRPDRLAQTAKTTPAAFAELARLFYEAEAGRAE